LNFPDFVANIALELREDRHLNRKRLILCVTILLLLVASIGCGTTNHLLSIQVTPSPGTISTIGGQQQFSAVGSFSNGTKTDLSTTVQWTSSAPTIASINATGLAQVSTAACATTTAKNPVVITATQSSVSGTALLNVTTNPPCP
jgi:hypothetical protein